MIYVYLTSTKHLAQYHAPKTGRDTTILPLSENDF